MAKRKTKADSLREQDEPVTVQTITEKQFNDDEFLLKCPRCKQIVIEQSEDAYNSVTYWGGSMVYKCEECKFEFVLKENVLRHWDVQVKRKELPECHLQPK